MFSSFSASTGFSRFNLLVEYNMETNTTMKTLTTAIATAVHGIVKLICAASAADR